MNTLSPQKTNSNTQPLRVAEVKPKNIPFKCVVCNGFGTVRYSAEKCHGCDGKGYIIVPNE